MARGYMGKMLWVDLSRGETAEERLDENLCRDYIGGHGLGARILFSRQRVGADPLGPESIFGLLTGPLTGTDGLGGSRYIIVGKSPLTGGWGDANSGGAVGPGLKFAGYDAVFVRGIADRPVYLIIDNGKAEIKDAGKIWGKDTYETEDILREEHGDDLEVACIGPAGEKVARIACVMNNKGRAAGRSGLGAVMGSKKLKAIAVKGKMTVPVADPQGVADLRKKYLGQLTGHVTMLRDIGTPSIFNHCAESDDAPCKNWGGVSVVDFPDYKQIGHEPVIERQARKYACWRCPIACGGHMKAGAGEYEYTEEAHKPEYETLAMFGSNLLNGNIESIIKANDICNRYGLDTISAGAGIAFTIECYENGLITTEDTDGLEMTWGNHAAIVAMTEKLGKREGFGDIIADGVKLAAEKLGKGSEKYAMHIGGQEIPGHDPKVGLHWAIMYGADPTPARHTQGGGQPPFPPGLIPEFDRSTLKGRGQPMKISHSLWQANCATGTCHFVFGALPDYEAFLEMLRAITGWDLTAEELLRTGERINNVRQAFNVREGMTDTPHVYPDRIMGIPPKAVGPRAGFTLHRDEMFDEYMEAAGWDPDTGKPTKAKLLELGLDDVAKVLWP